MQTVNLILPWLTLAAIVAHAIASQLRHNSTNAKLKEVADGIDAAANAVQGVPTVVQEVQAALPQTARDVGAGTGRTGSGIGR